jgi:peptidoglycan/xylan/chitin deacetylase (PgdA/CDA1 family)
MSAQTLILMYHHAGTPPPQARKKRLYVSAQRLAAQVRFLQARGYRFMTVSDALAQPDRANACVTFDDGYTDALEIARPVLRQLGAPATIYVVTDDVGKRGVSWAEENGTLPADLADWDALRALQAGGWEIGSHAHHHRKLAKLSEDEQARAVNDSFAMLARELGHPPRSFAYPYGSYDARTLQLVRQAGFASAVTTKRGVVRAGDDPHQLRRVNLFGHRAVDALQTLKLLLVHVGLYPLRPPPLLPTALVAQR